MSANIYPLLYVSSIHFGYIKNEVLDCGMIFRASDLPVEYSRERQKQKNKESHPRAQKYMDAFMFACPVVGWNICSAFHVVASRITWKEPNVKVDLVWLYDS